MSNGSFNRGRLFASLAGAMLFFSARAAAADSDLTVISCHGQSTISVSDYVWRFGQATFQTWDAFSQSWSENVCASEGATCEISPDLINVRIAIPYSTSKPFLLGKPNSTLFESYLIYRVDGKADYIEQVFDGTWTSTDHPESKPLAETSFVGKCQRSSDPSRQRTLF